MKVAYKKERVHSRRLAKQLSISEKDALKKVMEIAAGNQSLNTLVNARRQEADHALAKTIAAKQAKADARAKKNTENMPDPSAWLAWFDGATHPNPGKMGIGGLLKNPDGDVITSISYAAGQGDSSVAEYLALFAVLQAAVNARSKKLIIYGDSRVVLDDVQTKTAGAPILGSHRTRARELIAQLNDVTFIWIPRRKNSMADALSQQAIKLPSTYMPA
ncbi:ribonuclease HI family protein [Herminiimonas fonticola]|nr:ribonuclease HI family protein [Herminiimonas fonticola]